MILYLIRHGETSHNRDGLGLGRADVPLTARGLEQAAAVGARLADEPLDYILASPLQRAWRTAELVAGERGILIERRDELTELDVGETEGLPFPAIREQFGDFLSHWQGEGCASTRMPGGESLEDVAERVEPLLESLWERDEAGLAIVSHNFVLRVVLCRFLGIPLRQFRAMPLGLASITTVLLDRGRVSVRSLNDRCHLEMLEP
jgi:broad specificity phosphatase PhoE